MTSTPTTCFSKGGLVAGVVIFIAMLIGCRDQKIAAYRIPPEQKQSVTAAPAATPATPAASAPSMAMPADSNIRTGEGSDLRWKAPANWQEKPASSMRRGTYQIGTAELAITVFPGDVGGVLANVNRWRGQVGAAPVDASALSGVISSIEANGLTMTVTEALGSGASPQRVLAALVPVKTQTWFFKLTGPDAEVTAAKAAFLRFLETIETIEPATPSS